jgi:hypothetical protein
MTENLIGLIYVKGTSTIASTSPTIYEYTYEIPFLDFLAVAIIFGTAFFVFKLTFIDIWQD